MNWNAHKYEILSLIFGFLALAAERMGLVAVYFGAASATLLCVALLVFLYSNIEKNINWKEAIRNVSGKAKTLVLILACVLIGAVIAQGIDYYISNTGFIEYDTRTTSYLDGLPLENATSLNWGSMKRGNTYPWSNLTVQNIHTENITVLFTQTDLTANCSFTWAGNGTFLQPLEFVTADLFLHIGTEAPENTSFTGYWHITTVLS